MKSLARDADRAELVRRIQRVRPDTPRLWGRMTAHQMICHLSDGFRMAVGQKRVADRSNTVRRTLVKVVAMYAPLPWPRGAIRTTPELDQEQGGTCPGEFAADVADLVALVDLVATRDRNFTWAPHPFFGPMSHATWMRWAYLHTHHHLRQFGL